MAQRPHPCPLGVPSRAPLRVPGRVSGTGLGGLKFRVEGLVGVWRFSGFYKAFTKVLCGLL